MAGVNRYTVPTLQRTLGLKSRVNIFRISLSYQRRGSRNVLPYTTCSRRLHQSPAFRLSDNSIVAESEYFTKPSTLNTTLKSSGWEKVDESDKKYHFWKQTWKEQNPIQTVLRLSPIFPTFQSELPLALERDEYKRLYDWFYTNEFEKEKLRRLAVAITGHPGIGKSVFRLYVLYRRCVEGKPTLYYQHPECDLYLFHEGGVERLRYGHDTPNTVLSPFRPQTWLLVDGSQKEKSVPRFLALRDSLHPRIIFTASPSHEDEWKSWLKINITVRVVYMRGWDLHELRVGSILHNVSWDTVANRYHFIGKVPRFLYCDQLRYKQHISDIERAVGSLSVENLRQVLGGGFLSERSSGPGIPHHVQYLERPDKDALYACKTSLLSDHVVALIRRRMLELNLEERQAIIRMFLGSGQARQLVSNVYEVYVLNRLAQSEFSLEVNMYRMVCLDRTKSTVASGSGIERDRVSDGAGGSGKAKHQALSSNSTTSSRKEPQWYTAYGRPSKNRSLQEARDESFANPIKLQLKSMETITFEPGNDIIEVQTEKLYVPVARNKLGIDAFYVEGGVLQLLQMTPGAEHKVHDGILDLPRRFRNLPREWHLIFVQPYTTCMVVPRNKNFSHVKFFHLCIEPRGLTGKIPKEEAGETEEESK